MRRSASGSPVTAWLPRAAMLLFAAGTLARVLLAVRVLRAHPAAWFFAQASEYGELAQHVLAGCGLCAPFGVPMAPSAFLAPGYPLFVAAVFHLCGVFTRSAEVTIIAAQTLFELAAGVLLARAAQRLFDDRAAVLTMLLWAFAMPLMFFAVIFWESSFSFLVLVSLLGAAAALEERDTPQRWLWLGATLVVGYFVNPSLLPVSAAIIAWSAVVVWQRARSLRAAVIVIAVCGIAMSAWPLRNALALHAFIPARDNFGYELWQGNRDNADGFFDSALHPNNNTAEHNQLAAQGELEYMRDKTELAWRWITAHRGRFAELTAKRFASYWGGYEPGHHRTLLIYATGCTLIGWWALWRLRRGRAFWLMLPVLVLFPLPYYITHPDFRFREMMDAVLFLAIGSLAMRQPAFADELRFAASGEDAAATRSDIGTACH